MPYAEARRVPMEELLLLWRAAERRLARKELGLLDDLYAVAGLQSEVQVEGEKKKPKGKRVIPVSLNRRREELHARGYPKRRKPWSPERERRKIEQFWASANVEGETLLDLTSDEDDAPE